MRQSFPLAFWTARARLEDHEGAYGAPGEEEVLLEVKRKYYYYYCFFFGHYIRVALRIMKALMAPQVKKKYY